MNAKMSPGRRENIQGLLSVAPVVIIVILICGYPIGDAVAKSFTNWDGLYRLDWVGLSNYSDLFTNKEFWQLLKNSFILLLSVPLQALAGLFIAILLFEGIKGWKFFRTVYYLPSIISAVTIGFLFKVLFGYEGPINVILRGIGLEEAAVEWLGNGSLAISVIIFCLVWSNIGWQAILVFGGLSSISPSVFEAARIDGANYRQRVFSIIAPMLLRTMEYSFITGILWVFTGIFPFILTITNGGPGYETTTIDFMIYQKAFRGGGKLGAACALAIVLLVIILVITKLQMMLADKLDDWGE